MLKSIWPAMLRRLHGRPAGPVHLEVPFDVLAGPSGAPSYSTKRTHPSRLSPSALAQLRGLTGRLARLTRVAMLVGPELNSARGAKELRAFSRQFCLPVATTADVPGLFLEPHARHLGRFGYGGCSRAASVLLDETLEGLIVVGAGLDERNTLRWLPHLFRPGMALMLIRPVPLGPPDDCVRLTYVQADCADALRQLREWKRGSTRDFAATANARVKWVDSLHAVSIEPPLPPDATDAEGVHPAVLVQNMRRCLPDNAVLFVDSGLHRLFAYHYWSPRHRLGLITAARTAPTGWAICAAIGASLAGAPGPVVVLTGDGCMLMHGNELATAARYHAPVIFVVSSNSVNGNVVRRLRQVSPIAAELGSLPAVDWVAFARALGVPGCRARTRAEVQEALEAALAHTGPYVVEVMTPAECGVPIPEHAVTCCNVEFIRRMKPRKSPRQSASHAPRPSRR